jgi:hypothetical protein
MRTYGLGARRDRLAQTARYAAVSWQALALPANVKASTVEPLGATTLTTEWTGEGNLTSVEANGPHRTVLPLSGDFQAGLLPSRNVKHANRSVI